MLTKSLLSLAFASALVPSIGFSGEVEDAISAIRNMSYTAGQFDEGEAQVKQRRCAADGSYQDGKYRSFLTYAVGQPAVTYDESIDTFYVYHPYTCRVRTRIVSACGGAETNTDDTDYTGTIRLALTVTGFKSILKFDTTLTDLGGHERCGLGIANDIIKRVQNKSLK